MDGVEEGIETEHVPPDTAVLTAQVTALMTAPTDRKADSATAVRHPADSAICSGSSWSLQYLSDMLCQRHPSVSEMFR